MRTFRRDNQVGRSTSTKYPVKRYVPSRSWPGTCRETATLQAVGVPFSPLLRTTARQRTRHLLQASSSLQRTDLRSIPGDYLPRKRNPKKKSKYDLEITKQCRFLINSVQFNSLSKRFRVMTFLESTVFIRRDLGLWTRRLSKFFCQKFFLFFKSNFFQKMRVTFHCAAML